MRRLPGQAARATVRLLHRLALLALTVLMLSGVMGAALTWRLSRGPLDLGWLKDRIEAAVNADAGPIRVSIGGAALAWEGFSGGADVPLDLRVTDVAVTGTGGAGRMVIPRAEVTLSIRALLRGKVEPRSVEIDGARLTVMRAADGTTSLDIGTPREGDAATAPSAELPAAEPAPISDLLVSDLLAELARPAITDQGRPRGMMAQLRRVHIRDATLTVVDRQLGATWYAPSADIDLVRGAGGGVRARAVVTLALGDQRATLTLAGTLAPRSGTTKLKARLTPVAPAALARAAPLLAPLASLDAPIALEGEADMDAAMQPIRGNLTAQIGAGTIRLGAAAVPIASAALTIEGTPDMIRVDALRIVALGHDGAPPTNLSATGSVTRSADRVALTVNANVDQVAFADLPRLWPPGVATNARNWVLENVTSGNARNGHVDIALDVPRDLSDARVTRLSGGMEGDDLTVYWLRPIPPAEQGRAQLRFVDPDTLEITVQSGHQHGSARTSGLTIRGGRVRISGLSRRDQVATIDGDVTGPVANVIAVLREPRLHLLDTHPVDLRDPSGDAAVALTISLPLDENMRPDDVGIHAVAKLTDIHLRGFVAGRDIDHGMFDLDATADGLTVKGRTQVAGIAAQVDAAMDFRSGPLTQVQQRVTAVAQPGAGQLAAAGLDAGDMLFGEVPLKAVWAERRNGDSDIVIEADLTPAVLAASPIGWRKPSGVAAKGSARVLLSHGRITGVDRIAIDGEGITLRGAAGWDAAGPRSVTLDRARLGRTDVRGTIRLPAGGPIGVSLTGPSLDATGKLEARAPKPRASQEARQEPPDPAWTLDGRFDQVFLAHGQIARSVAASAANDGRVYRTLSVTGSTGGNGHFALNIAPDGVGSIAPSGAGVIAPSGGGAIPPSGRGRKLSLTAADAGSLLRGLAIARTIEGGRLAVTGTFDDSDPAHPLSATAEIDNFRVRDAPALGKLLQAMTLYGLVDVLGGPGLGFTRLIAPLRMTDRLIQLNDARAFSSSLGLTAKGRIDLDQERADIQGTIVPAYFFNSLLGHIPLIGKLFSPEQGGGLFAARYSLVGPLEDPAVSVNPLSALTPGFLRELFGIF